MYKVIKLFTDLQDDNYRYEVGDEYPRLGLKPSVARIKELSGSDNKQKTPLIEEIEDLKKKDTAEEIKTNDAKQSEEDKPVKTKRTSKKK
jgi:hypothetical protein